MEELVNPLVTARVRVFGLGRGIVLGLASGFGLRFGLG